MSSRRLFLRAGAPTVTSPLASARPPSFSFSRLMEPLMHVRHAIAVAMMCCSMSAVAGSECAVSRGTLTVQFDNAQAVIQRCKVACRVLMNDGAMREVACEADAPSKASVTACKREIPNAVSATLVAAECKPKKVN